MRIITLAKATPGLRLAKAVFSKDGRILLPAGDVLSSENIAKIREYGVSAIFVQDPEDKEVKAQSSPHAQSFKSDLEPGDVPWIVPGASNSSVNTVETDKVQNPEPSGNTTQVSAELPVVGGTPSETPTVKHDTDGVMPAEPLLPAENSGLTGSAKGQTAVEESVAKRGLTQVKASISVTQEPAVSGSPAGKENGVTGASTFSSFPGESIAVDDLSGIPIDIMDAAAEAASQRFTLTPREHKLCQTVFTLAVERQARMFLSNPNLMQINTGGTAPGFHTKKPEPVPMLSLLGASSKLGTLPLVFHKLIEIVNDPNASAADTAQVLSSDPALCAKLLKLVNSPYYGLPTRVDTIPRAVTLVGTGQIVMLAMGSTLMTAFKGMPVSLINMQTFWTHSLACGLASSLLAQKFGIGQPDSYFVLGLLHDIGKLLIYSQFPSHAMYMMLTARREQVSMHSLEKATLGFCHEELSAALLEEWRCPQNLVTGIKKHHKPLGENSNLASAILPVGNFLAQALGYGSSGDLYLPDLSKAAWNSLPLSSDELVLVCNALDAKIRGLRSIFSGHIR